jgi:hypothetical protein
MSAQIRLPNPADDRPRIAWVLAAALVGATLGVIVVMTASRAAGGPDPHLASDGRQPRPHASAPPAAAPARAAAPLTTGPGTPNLPGVAAAPPALPSAAVAPPVSPSLPAPTATAKPGGSRLARRTPAVEPVASAEPPPSRVTRVVPGRVAYVRCDGLSASSGPYPCPRDRVLEAAVWDLLDTLRECRGAHPIDDDRDAELRLDFRAGTATDVQLRADAPDQGDLEAALGRCLTEPLRRIETKLRPAHMVVSFRFQLL